MVDAKRTLEGRQTAAKNSRAVGGGGIGLAGQLRAQAPSTKEGEDTILVSGKFGRFNTFSGNAHKSLLSDIDALLRHERGRGGAGAGAGVSAKDGSQERVKNGSPWKDDREEIEDVLDKYSRRSLTRAKSMNIALSGLVRKDQSGSPLPVIADPFPPAEGLCVSDEKGVPQIDATNQRLKPASIAMAEAALAVEEIITEEVRRDLCLSHH